MEKNLQNQYFNSRVTPKSNLPLMDIIDSCGSMIFMSLPYRYEYWLLLLLFYCINRNECPGTVGH